MAKSNGGQSRDCPPLFPDFKLKGVSSSDPATGINEVALSDYKRKWLVAFFYPKDFTFVCLTEIKGFGDLNNDFKDRDAGVLAFNTDSEFVHLAWRHQKEELKDLPFALVSDIRRDSSFALGILDQEEGVAQRATYIIDPGGIIRFVSVHDMSTAKEMILELHQGNEAVI